MKVRTSLTDVVVVSSSVLFLFGAVPFTWLNVGLAAVMALVWKGIEEIAKTIIE